jgi:Protein of unknown function (DUF3617)
MIRHCSGRLLAAASLSILATAAVADERPGNLWKTTSQTVIANMPFSPPPNTMQLCTAKEWTQPPPPPAGQSCTVSNFQRTETKVSWDTQCTGEMEMSGHGEITFTSADSYTGTIEFASQGMTVTVNLTGTKIGECDNPVG